MKKVTIQAEGRVIFRKVMDLPDAEADEFSQFDDETILCSIDEGDDIHEITDIEIVDVHVAT